MLDSTSFNSLSTDIILIKSIICFFCSVLSLLFINNYSKISSLLNSNKTFLYVLLIFRIIPFIFIYLLLGFDARSDVGMFYDSASEALKFKFVYRDFESAYSPLFAYITAIPLLFWHSAKAIILELIIIEAAIVFFTPKVFDLKDAKFYQILYYLSAAPFVLSVLGGQEDIWMWGVMLIALIVYSKNKNLILFGVILGLGLLSTKAILVLYIPAILIYVKKPQKVIIGLLLVGIPSLIFMYYHSGMLFLSPIQQANAPRTPNIWSILHPITNGIVPLGPKYLNWVGLFTIQGLGVGLALWFRNKYNLNAFIITLFLVISIWLMVIQQSSLANYAYVFLLPLIFYLNIRENKAPAYLFIATNVFVVIQPAIWWGLGMPIFSTINSLTIGIHLVEYLFEIGLIVCLLLFLREIYFKIKKREFYG